MPTDAKHNGHVTVEVFGRCWLFLTSATCTFVDTNLKKVLFSNEKIYKYWSYSSLLDIRIVFLHWDFFSLLPLQQQWHCPRCSKTQFACSDTCALAWTLFVAQVDATFLEEASVWSVFPSMGCVGTGGAWRGCIVYRKDRQKLAIRTSTGSRTS